jgi:hypothetical protein
MNGIEIAERCHRDEVAAPGLTEQRHAAALLRAGSSPS